MNKSKHRPTISYCSVTPSYPINGYMAFISMNNADYSMYYPLDTILTDIDSTCHQIGELAGQLDDQISLEDTAILVPLKLRRLYPLRQQFWEHPVIHYDTIDKVKLFQHALKYYSWYQLVSTPLTHNDTTLFSIALPTPISEGDRAIEQFMLLSDFPVDETANCAGVYVMEMPFALDWKTKKVIHHSFSSETESLH